MRLDSSPVASSWRKGKRKNEKEPYFAGADQQHERQKVSVPHHVENRLSDLVKPRFRAIVISEVGRSSS